ncbi:SDR family NAD(P)-dependent oxidoreductase, partial [Clostridium perfringens]
ANGLQVIITSRDEEKGRLAVQELLADGLLVKLYVADVHEINDVARMMERIQSDYGRLDVLVNNAGVILDRGVSVLDVEESVVRATLETNFFGVLRMTQAAIPLMKLHHYGRIVNISSGLGAFEIMQDGYGLK